MKNLFSLLLLFSVLVSCNKTETRAEMQKETVYISGKVTCQNGEPLEGVKFLTNKNNGEIQNVFFTFPDGSYEIKLLDSGADYTIQIDYDDATINDEKDIENFNFLILEKPVIDAFTQIAGDVNRSGTITALDKIQVEENIETQTPSSWKIVPAELKYISDNQEFIFPNEFTRTLSLPNYDGTPIVQDFVGVKIGDLDKSICD